MCKKFSSADALPSAASRSRRSSAGAANNNITTSSSSSARTASSSSSAPGPGNTAANITSTTTASSSSRSSGRSSLAAARASLPDPPVLYPFRELAAATNSFLAKRAADPAHPHWRCVLRGRHAALFQLRSAPGGGGLTRAAAAAALARVARYHHTGLAPLLGACLAGPHVYLAYELPGPGAATLAACLQPRSSSSQNSPGFTVLRTWLSRVQIAADVAQGLDYVHNHAAQAHGRVSPSAVLVSDPGLRARLTHFGASQFAAAEDESGATPASREADVRAFGVLLLGLLSGEAAARHRFDRAAGEFVRVTVVETAAAAARSGRVRGWVDRRLGDSFPVAAAERLVEVGIRCAADAVADRPDMSWAAGKVSKAYVESIAWEHSLRPPANSDFSVSLAPR